MKLYCLTAILVSMCFLASNTFGQSATDSGSEDYGLPALHVMKTVTLAASNACQNAHGSSPSNPTALFLSTYSQQRNAPELLFESGCGSDDFFRTPDRGMITDLGEGIELENVSTQSSLFARKPTSNGPYSKFYRAVRAQMNHTYTVLVNTAEVRTLFVFTVLNHIINQQVALKYAVKEYQLLSDYALPALNTPNTVTLAPSYSCQKLTGPLAYNGTALFLSKYSKHRNMPELLFQGACGAKDSFTAGESMALVADLGEEVNLESLTAMSAFSTRAGTQELYSEFSQDVPVAANHTYAVLINKAEIRGFFVFAVTSYVPNEKVVLRYVVRDYQLLIRGAESPGFDWAKINQ